MHEAIVLDSGPLGLAAQRPNKPGAAACNQWLTDCLAAGRSVYVPEIADYEVRRELRRANLANGIARLDALHQILAYVPLNTTAMRLAADLWAQARTQGWTTADPKAIDGDVILAAQALTLTAASGSIIVATVNVAYISRYLPAFRWENIVP